MSEHELFAIIHKPAFWGGLKPPLSFLLQEQLEKKSVWQDVIGGFEFQRLFFIFITWILILFYIIYFQFPYNARSTAHLAKDVLGKRWDLGSIPRSPTLFHNFSCNIFLCSISSGDHHTTILSGLTHLLLFSSYLS